MDSSMKQLPMITVLAINGSPRTKNNTSLMLQEAIQGAKELGNVQVVSYDFNNKKIEGCRGSCIHYCQREGKCAIKDDLPEFIEAWKQSDGVLFGSPVYHVGPPGQVKCALDRLGNVQFAYLKGDYPRWNKACGVITQGSTRWGGQEITIQFFIESFLVLNCIPVTGDMPMSYMGVAGYSPTWEHNSIIKDQAALKGARNIGRRVAETATIVKAGINAVKSHLPDVYFSDRMFKKRKQQTSVSTLNWQVIDKQPLDSC